MPHQVNHAYQANRPKPADASPQLARSAAPAADTDGGWARLRGDCARMVPHWAVPAAAAEAVPASLIHGVVVPSASARLVGAMPEYGA